MVFTRNPVYGPRPPATIGAPELTFAVSVTSQPPVPVQTFGVSGNATTSVNHTFANLTPGESYLVTVVARHGSSNSSVQPVGEVHLGERIIETSLDFSAWASENYFRGGGNNLVFRGWLEAFFQWGAIVVKFHFTNSKLGVRHFSTIQISKSRWVKPSPPASTTDSHVFQYCCSGQIG